MPLCYPSRERSTSAYTYVHRACARGASPQSCPARPVNVVALPWAVLTHGSLYDTAKSSGDITRTELQRSLDCPEAVAPAPTRAQTKPMPPLPTRPNGLSSNNNDQRLSVSSSALPVYVFRDKKALPPVPSDAPPLAQQPPQLPPQPVPVHPNRYSLQVTPNRRRVAPPMHLPSRPPPVPTPALSKSAVLSPRSPRPQASPSLAASTTSSYTSSTLLSPRTPPPPPLALSGSGAKYAAPPVPVRPREARAASQLPRPSRPLPTSPTHNNT
jgi:hypothetical protein